MWILSTTLETKLTKVFESSGSLREWTIYYSRLGNVLV